MLACHCSVLAYIKELAGVAFFYCVFLESFLHVGRRDEKELTPTLGSQVQAIEKGLKEWEQTIKDFGCTLSQDGWTDCTKRNFVNTMVITNKGSFFKRAVDTSDHLGAKDADYISKLIINDINDIGPENVVSFVSDGAGVMRSAWVLVEAEFPHIVCQWCSAHVMDLLLEDMGKLAFFFESIESAKSVVKFIKNHAWTYGRFKKKTGKALLMPGDTRFATSFIMLDRLLLVKDILIELVCTAGFKDWLRGKKYKDEGEKVYKSVKVCLLSRMGELHISHTLSLTLKHTPLTHTHTYTHEFVYLHVHIVCVHLHTRTCARNTCACAGMFYYLNP
jgi:Protein of unknown function (DUF 659)